MKQSKKEEVGEAVKSAIATGYRHLDCAYIYDNETQIGSALKQVLAEGKVRREDLFITSKVWLPLPNARISVLETCSDQNQDQDRITGWG